MGVRDLWSLLAPCGRRTSVDALARKRLAIDASIWLIQFIKAMRDDKGEMVRNAPLLGLFRRVCKLLFLHVRPVLVFDGATPALKRRTVARRQAFRQRQEGSLRRTAEKILLNQMKGRQLLHGLEAAGGSGVTAAPSAAPPFAAAAAAAATSSTQAGYDPSDQFGGDEEEGDAMASSAVTWGASTGSGEAGESEEPEGTARLWGMGDDDDDDGDEAWEEVGSGCGPTGRAGGGGSGGRDEGGGGGDDHAGSSLRGGSRGERQGGGGSGSADGFGAVEKLVDGPTLQECIERAAEKQGHHLGHASALNLTSAQRLAHGSIVVPRARNLDTGVMKGLPPAMQFEVRGTARARAPANAQALPLPLSR